MLLLPPPCPPLGCGCAGAPEEDEEEKLRVEDTEQDHGLEGVGGLCGLGFREFGFRVNGLGFR